MAGKYNFYDKKTLACFDCMLEGILIVDRDLIVEYANDSYLEYAKMSRDQLIGFKFSDVRKGAITSDEFKTLTRHYNVYRKLEKEESYIDLIPFFKNEKKVGAMFVVRDVKVLNNLFLRIQEKENYISQLSRKIREDYQAEYTFGDVIGQDLPCWQLAKKVSQTDGSILLVGESGTGKELMAQSIHSGSTRRYRPFMDINCAAVPENLLESELFGYAPGAFTGANKNGKIGLFELANGGTIFLDEITEMPSALQSKLLRALQEKKIRRLGGRDNISLNVRVIAASNRNIMEAMETGRFRSDLYYRLAVFVITIPPLREHRQDIPEYIDSMIKEYEQKNHKKYVFRSDVKKKMLEYSWPGNMRQLRNALEYITQVSQNEDITYEDLPSYIFEEKGENKPVRIHNSIYKDKSMKEIIDKVELEILQRKIQEFGADINGRKNMAKALGLALSTLYIKLNKYHLLAERHDDL